MLDLQSIRFGQRHKEFDFKDMEIIKKVKRLYLRHHRQAENDCNGCGVVKGQSYYTGSIDDWAKRKYGYDVKSGYVNNKKYGEITIFYQELKNIQAKIEKLVYQFNLDKYSLWRVKPLRLEFQGDPRGYTVKLYYNDNLIEW